MCFLEKTTHYERKKVSDNGAEGLKVAGIRGPKK
jgi:hypothetical protein